jgi:O-antigen ligase
MIPSARLRDRRELLVGLGLGLYATAVALTPGVVPKAVLCAPLVLIPLAWRLLATSTAWLTLFLACALLTPPLPIRLGDSGPHVALLIAGAGLFIGLLRLSEWRFRADPLAASLLAIWFVFACSVSLAAFYSGPTVAAGSLVRVLLFGISIYVFLYVRDGPFRARPEQELRAIQFLYWAGVLSALFACVDFYFQFPTPAGYEQQFIWLDTGVYRRAQGVFYEASTLGNLCAFFLEMIAVALFRPQSVFKQRPDQPVSRLALFSGGAVLATALVLSFSRASLVNLGVALTVLLWLHRKQIRWRRLGIGVVSFGACAAAILMAAFPAFTGMAWLRLFNALQYFSESPNMVLSGRVASWQTLLNFLASNPWHAILGVGYKTLPYSDFIGATAVGDNTYLTLLVETGVLGLAAVVALNAAVLIYAYRAARSANPLRSFCGTWMACFWTGQVVQMFSADLLTYWRVLPVYFFVLALSVREEAR